MALLKATTSRVPSAPPPDTPSPAPPTTPFTQALPCFSPPIHPPPPATVPLVVTIKMNGKVLAERTTLPVPPTATWEAVARARLGWPTRPLLSRPRSRGRARHASRRASPLSSGRRSSRRVSARLAPRSRARSARSEQLDGFGNWLWQHSSLLLRLATVRHPGLADAPSRLAGTSEHGNRRQWVTGV